MSDILAYTNGICRQLELRDRLAAGAITITASVGIGGVNHDPDARKIQQALNDIPVNEGRATPILVVDGACGPLTKDAIQKFQLKHFGWKGADGRVDPDGQTLAKLNELRANRLPALQGVEMRIPRMAGLLNEAFSCIRVAQMNLLIALRVVDTPNGSSTFPSAEFSRTERMRKVNRHFDIDGYAPPQRSGVLRRILGIFDRMLEVFTRPGGLWGVAAFDVDPMERDAKAYAPVGGFSMMGELHTTDAGITIRKDAIYFCSSMDAEPDENCITIIIHELAHFCGGRIDTPEHITDFVSPAWHDHQTMRSLTREQKLKHAMCYNNFAWDAKHSRKPAGL